MADAQLPQGDDARGGILRNDATYRELVSEHQALDERLRQLSTFPFPSDQQHYEEISLKKRKLALKDRMQALLRAHQ